MFWNIGWDVRCGYGGGNDYIGGGQLDSIKNINMKPAQKKINYLSKIMQDESLQREWERIYNTSSANLGSESDTDFLGSRGSSFGDLSRFLKNAHFSFDLQESVEIGGKKSPGDASFYRDKFQQMVQINYYYRQKTLEIKENLNQSISFIHQNCSKCVKDFAMFSEYADGPLDEAANMAEYIKKTLGNVTSEGKAKQELEESKEKIVKLQKEVKNLSFNNQNLVSYIEDRKRYSESLKVKIAKLREEVKEIAKREESFREIFDAIDKFQDDQDLKYRPRPDLVLIIKSLLARILKHGKECDSFQDSKMLASQSLGSQGSQSLGRLPPKRNPE